MDSRSVTKVSGNDEIEDSGVVNFRDASIVILHS